MLLDPIPKNPENDCFDSLLSSVIDAVPAPIFYKDEAGIYLGCNQAFAKFVGKSKSEIIGKNVFELWEPENAKIYHKADQYLINHSKEHSYETTVINANGEIRQVVFYKSVFETNSGLKGLTGVMMDITDRKELESELRLAARTDQLTKLGNRTCFNETMQKICTRSETNAPLGLIAIDLDKFKQANDLYGHQVGDEILIRVSERLGSACDDSCVITRIGGDEFFIIIETPISKQATQNTAISVINQLCSPFTINGIEISICASIGLVYLDTAKDRTPEYFVNCADKALYISKKSGSGYITDYTDLNPFSCNLC